MKFTFKDSQCNNKGVLDIEIGIYLSKARLKRRGREQISRTVPGVSLVF
jgi:hypothetical protein